MTATCAVQNSRARSSTKADLRGSQLQLAMLGDAQLQSATLDDAQLQGAYLSRAQLQGASFQHSQLQGVSLAYAHLQGDWLYDANLEGVALNGAHLEGALFNEARLTGATISGALLSGASFDGAWRQGASLDHAQLQGVSLLWAQLQGASLDGAQLQGAWLAGTLLWRAQLGSNLAGLKDIRLDTVTLPNWRPEWFEKSEGVTKIDSSRPWTGKAYAALSQSVEREFRVILVGKARDGALRQAIERGVLVAEARDEALKRLKILDCKRESRTLASRDPSAESPAAVQIWEKAIAAASLDDPAAYAKELAALLGDRVCANEPNRIDVVRGLLRSARFWSTGSEMPALRKRITGLRGIDGCRQGQNRRSINDAVSITVLAKPQ